MMMMSPQLRPPFEGIIHPWHEGQGEDLVRSKLVLLLSLLECRRRLQQLLAGRHGGCLCGVDSGLWLGLTTPWTFIGRLGLSVCLSFVSLWLFLRNEAVSHFFRSEGSL